MHRNNTNIPNNQNISADFNGGSLTNFAGILSVFNFLLNFYFRNLGVIKFEMFYAKS